MAYDFRCSICEKRISRGWFCYKCYSAHKEDILSKKEWTKVMQNWEQQRRRYEKNEPPMTYLGSEWDIALVDGKYKLVPTQEHFEDS